MEQIIYPNKTPEEKIPPKEIPALQPAPQGATQPAAVPLEIIDTKPVNSVSRTYHSDTRDVLQKGSHTMQDVQGEQNRETPRPPNKIISRLVVGLSLLLFVGGGGVLAYVLTKKDPAPINVISNTLFLTPDSVQEILITNVSNKESIAAKLSATKEQLATSQIGTFAVMQFVHTPNETTPSVTATELMGILEMRPPITLVNTLGNNFLFGYYAGVTGISPFLLLQANSYDFAFSGLAQWEDGIADDMEGLFGKQFGKNLAPDGANPTALATTTTTTPAATSSMPTQNQPTLNRFENMVIKNRPVRILKNSDESARLLYGFIDRQTIVLTVSTDTFDAVAGRYTTPTVR